ncbi:hypothetical protein RZ532_00920 [Nitratireductor aquimarinus]|uniref:hypothetical protein n=1 Tax=Nitratireductor aquimarinus TaxID=889300 RepID=UPI002935B1CE|nr:hypothetical protein [Nitratireductor aquimarinus]MDV2964522.1 hypothetical protein [Nitratireductor aquimarinus]
MATRRNPLAGRYFNSPGIASAMSNLASAFAPPGADEVLGWAKANAARDEASRLSALWEAAGDDFDRMGVAVGQWNPNQSYYSVDQSNATTRRGQDIDATVAREKFAADNERALATNTADNQRQAITSMYGALNPGQVAPAVPAEIMEHLGLPAIDERAGAPKLISESEQKALERQRLLENGLLTDEMLVQGIMSDAPVEQVLTDDGPRFASRYDAIGQQPYDKPGTSSIKMYRTSDGRQGRTVDGLKDMMTGETIPADATVGSISDTSETFGTSELSKARDNILGRRAGLTSMINQVTAIDEQLAQANADQAIGLIGSAARVFNDVATQAGAALRAAGVDVPEGLRDVQLYQDSFRSMGVQNANLQSALLDLAYATAQAREPGRLTEADVERALNTIGANLQDPQAMRQVLRGAVERAKTDYNAVESVYFDQYGDSLNMQRAQFPDLPGMGNPDAPEDDEALFKRYGIQ